MRLLIVTIAVLAFAASATADTLREVTSRGITVTAPGETFDITFTPDGKFTGLDGHLSGTWRIDGASLCSTSNLDPTEKCVVYPTGKKSGDSFPVTSSLGTATVTIK